MPLQDDFVPREEAQLMKSGNDVIREEKKPAWRQSDRCQGGSACQNESAILAWRGRNVQLF